MDKQINTPVTESKLKSQSKIITKTRLFFLSFLIVTLTVLYFTNSFFTSRFSEVLKRQGQINLTKNAGNILTELQKSSIIPQLLVNDQKIIKALISKDFSLLSDKFSSFITDISIASITLFNENGSIVAFDAKKNFQKNRSYKILATNTKHTPETVMSILKKNNNEFGFFYSRGIEEENRSLGTIFIEVDLSKFEKAWTENGEAVFITDSAGLIILSSEPSWKGLNEKQAFNIKTPENAIKRVYNLTAGWSSLKGNETYEIAHTTTRFTENIPLLNWNISSFINHTSVRERVNTILAFEIMFLLFLIVLKIKET